MRRLMRALLAKTAANAGRELGGALLRVGHRDESSKIDALRCERVNRPDFGCALKTLVFQPNRDTLVGATRTLVHGALQRWLEREIVVEDVAVQADESTLTVQIVFTRRDTGERQSDVFTQAIGPAPAGAAS